MKTVDIKNRCIMIADDHIVNLNLYNAILTEHGYRNIILINDPRRFMEKFSLHEPSLVLLDLDMPYIDGFSIIQMIRAQKSLEQVQVIVLTAKQDKNSRLKSLKLGAIDVMSKPFDMDEFLMRVDRVLELQCLRDYEHRHSTAIEDLLIRRSDQLKQVRYSVIQRLGRAAEFRDEETGNHILRMSHICAILAKALGWDDSSCETILHASPMHDIGKIGIPDSILLKPARFNEAEWEIMKTHSEIGARLLDGDESELMMMAKEIALNHHEKWDGTGYPRGLSGENIPLSARIAAVADVFDALTSTRPYKPAWTLDKALEFIRTNSGHHFDPIIVDAFMKELPKILEIQEKFSDKDLNNIHSL